MPKVSIIVPFRTGEFFLKDCLDSLKDQLFTDYEVLIVLDGYTGDIEHTVGPYRSSFDIRVIETPDGHTGVAAARNAGLDNALGDFVYFLDSDDYIFEDAVAAMLAAAEGSGLDMVYGKIQNTYYKREIFLPIYIENREAMLAAEEESDSEPEEEEDKKEAVEENEGDSPESKESLSNVNSAIDRLITEQKRFRNVTVLHMLFSRSVIEKNHIRFDESLIYYCDFPFLAEFLDSDVSVACCEDACYIKRKHQDPINNPALSQVQDDRRFSQMIEMFNKIIAAVDPKGSVRTATDHQIIIYFTGYFVKKLKRSEHDFWREERFDAMHELSLGIGKSALKQEKIWRRRLVRALQKGNRERCIRLITVRLGFEKFKKILFKKNVLNKYLYRHKYLRKPISSNTIVFESFLGKNYSDSPKYIYEYLAKNCPGKYNFVWVLDNKTKLPYDGVKVKRFSRRYMYYMATSKYFVFNMRQPTWFKKRKGMVFLETWHGTPLKKLVFDLDEVYSASPLYKKEVYKQSREWDYLIAANEFSSNVFKSCFMYDGKMLEHGYPRNDLLHNPDRSDREKELREKLGIPKDKKTIFYAPTWRDDEYYGKGQYKFELKLDLAAMQKALSDEYVVLLRTHYFIADALDLKDMEGFAYNFSKYDDITELYLVSDIIITDYSSVFFDYANLKRPMLFYTYDLEKYRDVLRGFYIDIEEELPGPLLFTTQEVIDAVRDIESIKKKFAGKYDVFYEKYCGWEDGHAAENIVKEVF